MDWVRRAVAAGLVVGSLAVVPAGAGQASESCGTYRASCQAVCTPERADRYYAGSAARCSSSCEPRWNQCLRTGWWADIEYLYSGSWERASGW